MRPTTLRVLGFTCLVGLIIGFLGAGLWYRVTDERLAVPWSAPLVLIILALGFAAAALTLKPRIERKEGHQPLSPFVAARTAVLAMSSSRAGAAIAGVYLGYAVWMLSDLSNAYRRRLLLVGLLAAGSALALSAAALWLERICRIKEGDDDESGATTAA